MLLPDIFAEQTPDRPAIILGASGRTVTWADLIERSNRLANYFVSIGLKPGDHIAYILENNEYVHQIAWAGRRAGLYYTPINYHLKEEESSYIVQDCGAKLLIAQPATAELAIKAGKDIARKLIIGDDILPGFESFEDAIANASPERLKGLPEGNHMCYSSGTTGKPKGIKRTMTARTYGTPLDAEVNAMHDTFGFDENTVYLVPSPLHFAGGIGWTLGALRYGATVVIMEKFDPEEALRLIQTYKVTHSFFVPTHFVRMLKLSKEAREKYDVSSLKLVIHGAAATPIDVKEQMLAWWGPVIHEFYSSTESPGFVRITPEEWVHHKGSVGRPVWGNIRIVDEESKQVLPAGEAGIICFEGGTDFAYHNDPEKTKSAYEFHGWPTNGDIGYVDGEGWLYLTDRRSHMIISGGVNIYPQEAENVLTLHPAVKDVAVIGVPNREMGEEVKAVVIPENGFAPGPALEEELIAYARAQLASYKCPRSVDFVEELPRLETGKLLKRELRDRYWGDAKVRTAAM
ncbi:Acyl-CoA synthetase (AMP-forming)/AMP-acid ligase II [Sphingobium faniae]|nr:Acyl-CoA synthetase (AMP-forming)/AMP-acid ligase II [Sphingobium faniae]